MAKKDVIVGPTGNGDWSVKRSGNNRASSIHDTQGDAVDAGEKIARRDGVDLITRGRDGRIRSKDSYGNDPNPPRDREH